MPTLPASNAQHRHDVDTIPNAGHRQASRTGKLRGALLAAATLVACITLPAGPLRAQDAGAWQLNAEFGASMFFGASEQAAALVRSGLEYVDPRVELGFSGGFDYGEAKDAEGSRYVSKRSWIFQTNADYLPEGRVSPFVFATAEGSLERQIDVRTSGGAGAKYRFVDNERSRVDFSLAALVERTNPRAVPGVDSEVTSIGRWSARFRARHTIGDAQFDLVSFYRPKMGAFDDYTWDVNASVGVSLTSVLALRLSLIDQFDSLAEDRGARSNHDGRVLVSVLATLR